MSPPSSESEFSSTITRIAVAQICQSVGYTTAQASALDTLTDIATRYLRAIAHSAAASTNSSGRTQSNICDIIIALEDLGSVQGFVGAPNIVTSQCLISSPILKEIMRFLFYSDEIPFVQPIPKKVWPELRESGNEMNLGHVPRWLPDMPMMGGMEKEGNEEENLGCGFVEERNIKGNGKGKRFELPKNRGKVSFRMGMGKGVLGGEVGNRNGVMSRGGIGKRILCQSWRDSDVNEKNGKRKRVVVKTPR